MNSTAVSSIRSDALQTDRAESRIEISRRADWQGIPALAAGRFQGFLRFISKRFVGIGSERKRLMVRDTAPLGDRRFVSILQFERQRFLIGYSPSTVTLLAQLPDEFAAVEEPASEPTIASKAKESRGKKN